VGEPIVYVVQPGDTLWSIAGSINPDGRDLRATVDRLVDAAGGSILQPGQRIALPVG
jgi:LysM repeat protein